MKELRKILGPGLKNLSKVMEKVIAEFLIEDMKPSRDTAQYGNEKGVSVQHYLIRMLHNILVATDKNSQAEKFAVILSLIDWSQAFDRQSHQLGILSFIENGVRSSVIPYLISYFQKRKMVVKWNECFSSLRNLHGGGPQGGTFGNLEYLSQTNKNTEFLDINEKYKFIDDLSILEIINLLMIGIASYNHKSHVASDIEEQNKFIPTNHLKTQKYLKKKSMNGL